MSLLYDHTWQDVNVISIEIVFVMVVLFLNITSETFYYHILLSISQDGLPNQFNIEQT